MDKVYKYEQRTRTLEEVAELMGVSLEIKLLRGKKKLWQVKLERLSLYVESPLERRFIICRNTNPNFAMAQLCEKISYKTVVAPQIRGANKVVTLGLVERGALYLRLEGLIT